MDFESYYNQRHEVLRQQIQVLKKKSRMYVSGEIVSFLAIIGFVVVYVNHSSVPLWLLGAFLSFVCYLVIRFHDERNDTAIERLEALAHVCERELSALKGNYSVFADGQEYVDAHHEYTFDLDVFGPDSLFNRINRTVTSGGSKFLADRLAGVGKETVDIAARQQMLSELKDKEDWRIEFMSKGDGKLLQSEQMITVLRTVSGLKISSWAASMVALGIAVASLVGFYGSIVLSMLGIVDVQLPIWWGILQFMIVVALNGKKLGIVSKAVSAIHEQVSVFIELIALIRQEKYQSERARYLYDLLEPALDSIGQLDELFRGIDRRNSFMGIVVLNVFALTDFFLCRKFIRWQQQYLDQIQEWVDVISEYDSAVSMATMAFNHPATCQAEIISSDEIIYEARELYHPFLGAKARRNDFEIHHHDFDIITGANMAGKSTFLRAVGVNYILAMVGMPVFAEQFRVSRFKLFSSMRTQDDLTHGISYFNAELLRLKQLISYCSDAAEDKKNSRPTLIILDEILKGTNSVDKLNGSRMFLQAMVKKNAAGIVATHDLELSKMAEEQPETFHNYCFEIKMGTDVTYDYRITSGVARNQNATFLLKKILEEC